MNKQDQFIEWLCGKDVEFPFFKDLPQVQMPIMESEEEDNAVVGVGSDMELDPE